MFKMSIIWSFAVLFIFQFKYNWVTLARLAADHRLNYSQIVLGIKVNCNALPGHTRQSREYLIGRPFKLITTETPSKYWNSLQQSDANWPQFAIFSATANQRFWYNHRIMFISISCGRNWFGVCVFCLCQ